MASVRIPIEAPQLPTEAAVRFGIPVQSATMRCFVDGANHIVGLRMRRACHVPVDYDTSTTDLIDQTPDGISSAVTIAALTVSDRARYLWVGVRYQADVGSGGSAQQLDISLRRLSDGVDIDKGVRFTSDHLSASSISGGVETWPVRNAHTGWRIDDTAGATQTAPRLLNVDDQQDTLLEVICTADNVRVVSIDVWESVEMTVEQVFI